MNELREYVNMFDKDWYYLNKGILPEEGEAVYALLVSNNSLPATYNDGKFEFGYKLPWISADGHNVVAWKPYRKHNNIRG